MVVITRFWWIGIIITFRASINHSITRYKTGQPINSNDYLLNQNEMIKNNRLSVELRLKRGRTVSSQYHSHPEWKESIPIWYESLTHPRHLPIWSFRPSWDVFGCYDQNWTRLDPNSSSVWMLKRSLMIKTTDLWHVFDGPTADYRTQINSTNLYRLYMPDERQNENLHNKIQMRHSFVHNKSPDFVDPLQPLLVKLN